LRVRGRRLQAFDVFLWSRLAIWLGAVVAAYLIRATPDPLSQRADVVELTHDLGIVTDVWAHWDAVPFLRIAEHGYDSGDAGAPAFYPLYPSLVGGLGRLLGDHFVLAGVLISLLACGAAFHLLARLASAKLGESAARSAVIYLAVFPTSFFLQAVYSEALFLALTLLAFVSVERRRLAICGIAAGLALLTRPLGVAAVLPLALIAWRHRRRIRDVAWIALAPIVFLAYPAVLQFTIGEPLAFLDVEKAWDRSASPLGPFAGLTDAARAAWAGVLQLSIGSAEHPYWTTVDPDRTAVTNLEAVGYLALFVLLSAYAWRRLGAPYGLFCVLSLAIPLSSPTRLHPLLSLPRFGLVIFPFFLALGAYTEDRPRLAAGILGASAILLGVGVVRWSLWQVLT
jgi:hypothetical protein